MRPGVAHVHVCDRVAHGRARAPTPKGSHRASAAERRREGDQAPYGPKYGPIGLKQVLEAARQHPHWTAPLGAHQGRGVACGFWFNAGLNSSATVALDIDGSATVVTGNPDIGGTRVAQALMVSEELGIPVERVRPVVADTDTAGSAT
jgi:CO/xanthine dehydrogenase Mo-binding subunit